MCDNCESGDEGMHGVAVLDDAALKMLSDDLGVGQLERLLIEFRDSLSRHAEQIAAVVVARDAKAIRMAAHGLKGLCMQFGALRVVPIARAIEVEPTAFDQVENWMPKLNGAIADVREALQARKGVVKDLMIGSNAIDLSQ